MAVFLLLALPGPLEGQETAPEKSNAAAQAAADPFRQADDAQSAGAFSGMTINPDDTCGGKPAGSACWMELKNHPGCFVWNEMLRHGHSVTWSGECSGGLIQGAGTETWIYGGEEEKKDIGEGEYADGKRIGTWTQKQSTGGVREGSYLAGLRSGHWIEQRRDGSVFEGPYVDGKRSGYWVHRYASGTVMEGPYLEGERSGIWLIRQKDGTVAEGSLFEGKRSGNWVEVFPGGLEMEGPYEDNERNGRWVIRDQGNVSKGEFRGGRKEGLWEERLRDGSVLRGRYRNDQRDGRWTERHRNGDELEGSYRNGRRDGRWKLRRSGQEHEIRYSNGVQVD